MRENNYTMFGIHSKAERDLLMTYRVLTAISCLLGDTLILIGTIRYKAVKLHHIIVILMQHMAVADILLAIFNTIPGIISLSYNKWQFGLIFCYVSYYVRDCCLSAINILTFFMGLSKMLITRYPMEAFTMDSQKVGQRICASVWVLSCIFPTAAISKDPLSIYFSYILYNCDIECSLDLWKPKEKIVYLTSIGLIILGSVIGSIVSNTLLIIKVKKVTRRDGLQLQGFITIILSVAAHVAFALPIASFYISTNFVSKENMFVHKTLYRFGYFLTVMASPSCFLILAASQQSFRAFLMSTIRKFVWYRGSEGERQRIIAS